MKNIAKQIKDQIFKEHIDEIQFTLFIDNELSDIDTKEVWKHLSQCKRCREVLKMTSEIRIEEEKIQSVHQLNKKKLQPANNLDYKSTLLKRLGGVAVMFLILLVPVEIEKLNAPVFKGITEEKNIIEEAIEYWEERFNRWFGENK